MLQSAAFHKVLTFRREELLEPTHSVFRLRRRQESGVLRFLLLAAALVGLAGVLGSVTVSAETRKVAQPVAQQAAPAEAAQPRRAVRVIQIHNLPAR